jgi:methionyl-tRNA formyltransferase
MKITILCSDSLHPVNTHIQSWMVHHQDHQIDLVRSKSELSRGDLLFLISCSEIVNEADRKSYSKTLVIHASDLPRGRGWSPHIWQLVGGAEVLTLTLLEAAKKVDSGDVWQKLEVKVSKDALWDEINQVVFDAELELMDFAVENFGQTSPLAQSTLIEATYFPKRSPTDSKIDPRKSIEEQFDLIRVCDPDRFPAYFELHGFKYKIRLVKAKCLKP